MTGSPQVVVFEESLRGTVRAVERAPRWDADRLACALAAESVLAPAGELRSCALHGLRIAVDVGAATADGALAGVVRAGRVDVDGLPRLTVHDGQFALFGRAPGDGRRLRYRLRLRDPDGAPWLLRGTKLVVGEAAGGPARRAWAETTTLYLTLEPPAGADGPPAYLGVVRLSLADFARQLATLRGEPGPAGGLTAVRRLAAAFRSTLTEVYLRGGDATAAPGIEAAFGE